MRDEDRTQRGQSLAPGLLPNMVWFATKYGVSMTRISQVTGIPGPHLVAPDRRHPYDAIGLIWRELRALHPDRPLPLERAKTTPAPAFYDLWQGAHFAPDLRTALEHVVQFCRLASDDLTLSLVDDPPALPMSHPADVIDAGAAATVGITIKYRIINELLNLPQALSAVHIGWPPFGPPAAYEAFFRVPVHFHAPRTALCFADGALSTPLPAANEQAFEDARRRLGERLARLAARDPLALVRYAITANATEGEYTAEALARRVQVSLRVLQRLVAEHGFTPTALIDDMRAERARRLLDDQRLSVAEVAGLIGYSDERSFRRAFQRATGHTPARYRRMRRGT